MRRAQISTEFLFVMGFAALILFGFLFTILVVQQDTAADEQRAAAERIASEIRQELVTAAVVIDGFERTFSVSESVRGRSVLITARPEAVLVMVGDQEAYVRTPPYQGTPRAGDNVLRKQDGVLVFV